jgi:hypothetical protein
MDDSIFNATLMKILAIYVQQFNVCNDSVFLDILEGLVRHWERNVEFPGTVEAKDVGFLVLISLAYKASGCSEEQQTFVAGASGVGMKTAFPSSPKYAKSWKHRVSPR